MRDPREEPLENYDKIIAGLVEVAKKLGLYCQGAAIMINPDPSGGGPTLIQASFVVGEVAPELADDPDSVKLREDFDQIMKSAHQAEEEQVAEQLRKDLRDGRGLFGPDAE